MNERRQYTFIGGVGHEERHEVPNQGGFSLPVYPKQSVSLKIPFAATCDDRPDYNVSVNHYEFKEYRCWSKERQRWVDVKVYQWEGMSEEQAIEYLNKRYGV